MPHNGQLTPAGICVMGSIREERLRQEDLREAGKFPFTCATPHGLTEAEKLGVLAEEFGEVAQLVCHYKIPNEPNTEPPLSYHKDLREELIQVAAVCVAWAECL